MESSGPETTPVSPVLAGRFLSTMPPGKFNRFLRYLYKYFLSYTSKLLLHHVATVTFGKMKTISILLQLDLTFWAWACLTLDLWCLWSYSWYPCMRRAGRSSSYRVNLESVQDWTQWVNACSSAPSSWQFRGASHDLQRVTARPSYRHPQLWPAPRCILILSVPSPAFHSSQSLLMTPWDNVL